MTKRRYLTTAIDFPNAAPHMGHVYEKILADVIVRWWRLSGDDVRFHLGTDENGIKMQQTAKGLGLTPRELVDQNAPLFESLFRRLHISFDYFIRTADPSSHWPTVVELWNRLKGAGFLEKRSYTGLYCTGCERFVLPKDLVDGKCPDHKTAPQEVTEENWFFLLRKKQKDVQKLLDPKSGSYTIVPSWRANETLTFLEGQLEDISFSRSKDTLTWGVPVPGDDGQVMYVWCDNLTSYISSLGFFTKDEQREWWDGAEVTHVIGKDIARFHAINWPAMLQCAGLKTPDRLLVHGFITSEGQKMSKSIGNVVVPDDVISKYGVDALRFFLMHEVPVGNDGDFSWKRFGEMYDAYLRNTLGNLLNRVLVMLGKSGGEIALQKNSTWDVQSSWNSYAEAFEGFSMQGVVHAMGMAKIGNQRFNEVEPWKMKDDLRVSTLSEFAEYLRHIALMLLPFIPETAQKISRQLNVPYADAMLEKKFVITKQMKEWGGMREWTKVGTPEILFPVVEHAHGQKGEK